jgi:transcriptional antiterminator RfaH
MSDNSEIVPVPNEPVVAPWCVAHTRPRCEKKLADYCGRQGLVVTLPTFRSVKKYRGKTAVFLKPLFPGYVFLRLHPPERQGVYQSDFVANLLTVPDQAEFEQQLGDILRALDTELDVRLAPTIGTGMRVRIRSGPLQGVEGWVESRRGLADEVEAQEDFGHAAAVKLDAGQLELI